jgi:uncharacterized LabA/DUF88 family protein
MNRISAYIDGYNLYHALRENNWQKYYWLSLYDLMNSFVQVNSMLYQIYYFTADSYNTHSRNRQRKYLKALTADGKIKNCNLSIIYGHFKSDDVICNFCNQLAQCHNCEEILSFHHEKQTDINISLQMICDAFEEKYDIAFLLTADSDQVGTIKAIKKFTPEKKVFVIFPPGRYSSELVNAADGKYLQMSHKRLAKCQLPDDVIIEENLVVSRPQEWH